MPISSSETPSSAAENFGPYFFAWADEGDAFDPAIHTRFDDDIFEYQLDQSEGDFASLAITVKNPRIGLLAPGRQIWGWFSWWNGSEAIPLFFGRLVGLPDNLADDTVSLNFTARPSNFADQKVAYAAGLKVRPYWDSIWFDSSTRDNPDNVLESRPELWHIDRVTHEVTTSNIINGEDGTLNFDEDDVFYDSVKVSYAQNPLRTVQMTAQVSWDQIGSGVAAPPPGPFVQPGMVIESRTGEGLAAAWPKPGASIGGGWSVGNSSVSVSGAIDSSLIGVVVFPSKPGEVTTHYADGGFDTSFGTWGKAADTSNIGWSYHVAIPMIKLKYTFDLVWSANRRKTETLTFTLAADVQDILTLPDDGEVLALSMASSEVAANVDPDAEGGSSATGGGVSPLGSPMARSYFTTDRGAASVEYLIAIARANLLARSRAVNVGFEISFEQAIASGVTLRKNAVIQDARLPGVSVGGKITAYSFAMMNGAQSAQITIGCTIGKDGSVTESRGDPDYCETDYVDGEIGSNESPSSLATDLFYQTYTGQFLLPFVSDVAYESILGLPANDDGIDLTRIGNHSVGMQLLNAVRDEKQEDALNRFTVAVDDTGKVTATNTVFDQLKLTVPDLTGGPFETDYAVNVTQLKIPRTINLEAASEGASSS